MADNLTTNNNLYTLTPQLLQKNTYKTHYNCFSLVYFFIGIIVGGGIMIFSIYTYIKDKNNYIIIFIIFSFIWILMFACVVGRIKNLYILFSIDTYIGIIKVERVKIFYCFNKKIEIQIKDVQKVIIQNDNYEDFDGSIIDAIKVIFKLNNESEIKGCSRLLNSNNESYKIYKFIRSSLPENISVAVRI